MNTLFAALHNEPDLIRLIKVLLQQGGLLKQQELHRVRLRLLYLNGMENSNEVLHIFV